MCSQFFLNFSSSTSPVHDIFNFMNRDIVLLTESITPKVNNIFFQKQNHQAKRISVEISPNHNKSQEMDICAVFWTF